VRRQRRREPSELAAAKAVRAPIEIGVGVGGGFDKGRAPALPAMLCPRAAEARGGKRLLRHHPNAKPRASLRREL
jgi:hypothetical protein